jgi:2-polyprenyl-3-methyl-5-hydroxy-6-metoxy-1,4-benzoquinol methylase
MNPQPLEEEVHFRYGKRSGEDYLAYELTNEKAFLDLQLLALGDAGFCELEKELFAKRKEAPSVLDIGCATGSLLANLKMRGWKTAGVEISGPQAEYARRERKLDVMSLTLEKNNFPGMSFDVVLASHLIEHLNSPSAMLREVHRLLVPGGRFFVTTPNIAGFQARLFSGRWRSPIFDHLYLFSLKTLSRLLKGAGFEIEKTATWGGLGAGLAPLPVKRFFDKAAKIFNFGDVMIIRAKKNYL